MDNTKRIEEKVDDLARITAKGFENVDGRFEQVDKRFERVESEIRGVRQELSGVRTTVDQVHKRCISLVVLPY
jgi:hypothetical protein